MMCAMVLKGFVSLATSERITVGMTKPGEYKSGCKEGSEVGVVRVRALDRWKRCKSSLYVDADPGVRS